MESHFFQRLVNIPIFQGISRDDFINIASKVHFDFRSYKPGETIAYADEACSSLICVISGSIEQIMRAEDGSYFFREYIDRPTVLQPERLFGLYPRYSASFVATKETSVLCVPKHEVRDILFGYITFHINYLNLVCTAKQQCESRLWKTLPEPLEHRFVHFVTTRSQRPAGRKEIEIGMVQLAEELVTTRLNVSKMLNRLKDENLIYLSRGLIVIPELEKLIQRQKNA